MNNIIKIVISSLLLVACKPSSDSSQSGSLRGAYVFPSNLLNPGDGEVLVSAISIVSCTGVNGEAVDNGLCQDPSVVFKTYKSPEGQMVLPYFGATDGRVLIDVKEGENFSALNESAKIARISEVLVCDASFERVVAECRIPGYDIVDNTNPTRLPNTLGARHTCVMKSANNLECAGSNASGSLGTSDNLSPPSPVTTFFTNVRQASLTRDYTCVVRNDDQVECSGNNSRGVFGNGTTASTNSPVLIPEFSNAKFIASGATVNCAIMQDGSVKCAGMNGSGQLGMGDFVNRSSAETVPGFSNAIELAVGGTHVCAILSGGVVKCTGANSFGQLGDGSSEIFRLSPVTIPGFTGTKKIYAGNYHTCAILDSGDVKCVGKNSYGQLGLGHNNEVSTPEVVAGFKNATELALGAEHTCAIMPDHSVKCVGDNQYGQLGNATNRTTNTIIRISGFHGAKSIAAGSHHTCVVRRDNQVVCTGRNLGGSLGTGDTSNLNAPVITLF